MGLSSLRKSLLGRVIRMVAVYFRKMTRGDGYKISQVPDRWRTEVVAMLHENGWVINSDGTASKE